MKILLISLIITAFFQGYEQRTHLKDDSVVINNSLLKKKDTLFVTIAYCTEEGCDPWTSELKTMGINRCKFVISKCEQIVYNGIAISADKELLNKILAIYEQQQKSKTKAKAKK